MQAAELQRPPISDQNMSTEHFRAHNVAASCTAQGPMPIEKTSRVRLIGTTGILSHMQGGRRYSLVRFAIWASSPPDCIASGYSACIRPPCVRRGAQQLY
jgi:hypothetical protein